MNENIVGIMETTSIWLMAEQAAEYLRLKPETLHYYRAKGIGPRYYVNPGGRSVRYLREDLDEYMRQGVVEPTAVEEANG